MTYPKRLIEVDLPIKQISAHARREKSIRHGHISTLHIWWARRPLAACRAVTCAALWPDPADELCPQPFRDAATRILTDFAEQVRTDATLAGLVADHWSRWHRTNIQSFSRSVRSPKSLSQNSPTPDFGLSDPGLSDPGPRTDRPSDSVFYADMRYALLDFIADFANWDASTIPAFLETARALTQAAHEALGGLPGTRPLVVDPFAGGGAIPLEALRVGADAFASDLNPVAVLLNKVVLEYIPKYGNAEFRFKDPSHVTLSEAKSLPAGTGDSSASGPSASSGQALRMTTKDDGDDIVLHGLAEAVRYWGQWIKEQAEAELAQFYPPDPDGATPIAYLWARTIISEAPDDGSGLPVEVPLMRSLWLAKKKGRNRALRWVRDANGRVQTDTVTVTYADGETRTVRRPRLEIFEPKKASEVKDGTVARGSATCPVTGYTTPVDSVRRQLKARRGGAADARLFAVVTTRPHERGRFYRLPTDRDLAAARAAAEELARRQTAHTGPLSLVPDEPYPDETGAGALSSSVIYGPKVWGDIFLERQLLVLTTLVKQETYLKKILSGEFEQQLTTAIHTFLSLAIDRCANQFASLCKWNPSREMVDGVFARQALPMMWDFGEISFIGGASGYWTGAVNWIVAVIESQSLITTGQSQRASATSHPLPDDISQCFFTDPPYYDAIAYADLSDFFYVWLRRTLGDEYPTLFSETLTEKTDEIVHLSKRFSGPYSHKTEEYFENGMKLAMGEGRRILSPSGVGIVVFAHKSTTGWEAQLQAMIDAGWTVTGSWPIDTERGNRTNAIGTATLASSIHLVCRPRENADGLLATAAIGDWRDVLRALPERIHAWLPRLAREGVVGADAIFACLGPALEIYSRYSRVEKASGEAVSLGEYLEYVWAAVSKEALSMVFAGADASGFEEDARLTAMWLWTLNDSPTVQSHSVRSPKSDLNDPGLSDPGLKDFGQEIIKSSGYALEYDAARKIAQGLGVHLDKLGRLVEVKGSNARLLPVTERAGYLFGKEGVEAVGGGARRKNRQMSLFEAATETGAPSADWDFDSSQLTIGNSQFTILDRVHQSMLLFAAGRSDALKRFLVDEGVGQDARYWSLANALSALYPPATDEKRWVDGVLARKKGLGF